MAIDFFQKEKDKVLDRVIAICNDKNNCHLAKDINVIFRVIYMGRIANKLTKQKRSKDLTLIKEFMENRSVLNVLFDKLENEKKQTQLRKENESCMIEKYVQNAGT